MTGKDIIVILSQNGTPMASTRIKSDDIQTQANAIEKAQQHPASIGEKSLQAARNGRSPPTTWCWQPPSSPTCCSSASRSTSLFATSART